MFSLIRMVLALCLLALPSAALAEWREATSEHFVIVSEASERQLRLTAQRLEAVHWLLGQATNRANAPLGSRVRIYMVDDADEVRRGAGAPPDASLVGIYIGNPFGPIAIVARNRPASDLYHEYAHHFMAQYMPVQVPAWYVEGFAEVVSTASFEREGSITYGKVANEREAELRYLQWTPTARMFAERTESGRHAGYASYGQYWLTAHYLQFAPERRGQLARYVDALNRGMEPDAAAELTFPGGLDQLDADLRAYLRRADFRYVAPTIPPGTMRDPVIRTLRPGEAAALELEMAVARTWDTEDSLALVPQITALAARHPNEPAIYALQAAALLRGEAWAEAMTAADRALALDPNHARSNAVRAIASMRLETEGDASNVLEAAQASIERARSADPREPLLRFAERLGLGQGGDAPERTLRPMSPPPDLPTYQITQTQLNSYRQAMSAGGADGARRLRELAEQTADTPLADHWRLLATFLEGRGTGRPPSARFIIVGN